MEDRVGEVQALFAAAINLATTGDRDGDGYWDAIQQLHRRPERAVFESAAGLCASPRAVERRVGADVLAQLGTGPRPFATESVSILQPMLDDSDEAVIVSAVHALGHLKGAHISAVRRLATHPSAEVRYAVTHLLIHRDEPEAIELLLELMRDPSDDVRNWATFAIAQQTDLDTLAIRQALSERLTERDDEIRGEAFVGLARRGDLLIIDQIVREVEGDPGSLVFDAADEILKHVPEEPRITAALSKWRAGS
jgi:HEAT repeat protein